MGKWAKYGKSYCKEWERDKKLKDWVQPVSGDTGKAACKYCKTVIRAHYNDLSNHADTSKHKRNARPGSNVRTLFDVGVKVTPELNNTNKEVELKLAAHIACHSSIATIDHLGEIVKNISNYNSISIHRTKCSALIKNVLSKTMREELLDDLKNTQYSLIIDESTDISCEKQLCVLVRYCSEISRRIVTAFLGMIPLRSRSAEAIFQGISEFLSANNLPIENCIGLATDGCNVMCGRSNSVITKFKVINTNFIHIKCICHSLQLCSSYALKTLPRNVEFMVSETYNWFSHSVARQQKYKELYGKINVGEEPLKILKMCDTRWLSIAPCVQRILDQFNVLKLHFCLSKDVERNYTAELLYQMYNDIANKLYLTFLHPVLIDINRVNKLFQTEKCSPIRLVEDLVVLYRTILLRVMRPTTFTSWATTLQYDINNMANHLPINAVYFGTEFHLLLDQSNLETVEVMNIKERCCSYMLELLQEMQKRLPTNIEQLQSLTNLSPSVVLSPNKPLLHKISFIQLYRGNIAVIDQQWNRLNSVQWPYSDDVDVEKFWINVANHTDASSEKDFFELGKFVLSVLALPFSNAAVERSFSEMNLIKTNQRNRMHQDMLEALLHVRCYMERHNICCSSFKPSLQMLSKFDVNMYDHKQS